MRINQYFTHCCGITFQKCRSILVKIIFLFVFINCHTVYATDVDIPHVDQNALDSYQFDYLYAGQHRAFAIAPGGAWSWQANKPNPGEAKETALQSCAKYTKQKCVLFAVDNDIVFDIKKWSTLWGPYASSNEANKATNGTQPGQKFPDLKYTDPSGLSKTLSGLKGKVVFVHFWGCWCPSCRHEFSALIDMYRILKNTLGNKVEFVVLQVREPIEKARQWAKENKVEALPLSDSGVKSVSDTIFKLKDGNTIDDRELATVFPASYVLDKHGIVIFSHMGSVHDWSEYVPFFKDAVAKSGK